MIDPIDRQTIYNLSRNVMYTVGFIIKEDKKDQFSLFCIKFYSQNELK